jgi:hypothetical protein
MAGPAAASLLLQVRALCNALGTPFTINGDTASIP